MMERLAALAAQGDDEAIETYARALHRRGRTVEALRLLETLGDEGVEYRYEDRYKRHFTIYTSTKPVRMGDKNVAQEAIHDLERPAAIKAYRPISYARHGRTILTWDSEAEEAPCTT